MEDTLNISCRYILCGPQHLRLHVALGSQSICGSPGLQSSMMITAAALGRMFVRFHPIFEEDVDVASANAVIP